MSFFGDWWRSDWYDIVMDDEVVFADGIPLYFGSDEDGFLYYDEVTDDALKLVTNAQGLQIWHSDEGTNDYIQIGATTSNSYIDSYAGDMYFRRGGNSKAAVTNSGVYLPDDGLAIIGYDTDTGYGRITARDAGVGQVEVARFQAAADPYFSMGAGQEHKFTTAGLMGVFGATPVAQQLKANHNDWAAVSDVVNALANLGFLDQA